jgi:HSP20 family protein
MEELRMYNLITRDVDSFLDSFFYQPVKNINKNKLLSDIKELKDKYIITLDMPGIPTENLKVSLDGDILLTEGKIEAQSEDASGSRFYKQSWVIPKDIDQEKIAAELKFGVLTITLPKSSVAGVRDIQVLDVK